MRFESVLWSFPETDVTVPAFPVTLPVIALVTVISVAHSFVSLLVVPPIVWPTVWSVSTAPVRDCKALSAKSREALTDASSLVSSIEPAISEAVIF